MTLFPTNISRHERQSLFSVGTIESFDTDKTIIQQGAMQQSLYVVLQGALRAYCHSNFSVVEIGILTKGDCFGEMSMFDPLKASATIKSSEAGSLWKIARSDLKIYLDEHPRAGIKLLTFFGTQLTRRMRKAEDQILRINERPVGFDNDY